MLEDRAGDARMLYAESQRELRELGTPFWVALTDLDVVITGAMQPDERRRAAAEAREILERLRATALLERLDAALADERATTSKPESPVREEIGQEA